MRALFVSPRCDTDEPDCAGRHRDTPPAERWPHPRARFIKQFVNIFDVEPHGGPLSGAHPVFQPTHADSEVCARAVVPGSHRLMDNPWELYGTSFRSSLTLDAELPQEAMPNHCECIVATAAVCVF